MQLEQFANENLSHYSYAVLSEYEKKMILIDPGRDLSPYYNFAQLYEAQITGVILTHLHSDFVSGHRELQQATGATLYISPKAQAQFPHVPLQEGDQLRLGKIELEIWETPGHSPESISIVARYGKRTVAVFTGDTLLHGEVGRPDYPAPLQETLWEQGCRELFHSTHQRLATLPDSVKVYPAHGAGYLQCRSVSNARGSNMGAEKRSNFALQPMSEEAFCRYLNKDRLVLPAHMGYIRSLNRRGLPPLATSVQAVAWCEDNYQPEPDHLVIDVREATAFHTSHWPGAINVPLCPFFEFWLGTLIDHQEPFYLTGASAEQVQRAMVRTASIGYEQHLQGVFVTHAAQGVPSPILDYNALNGQLHAFTIVDTSCRFEQRRERPYPNAIPLPLVEWRNRIQEIPTDKSVVVCSTEGPSTIVSSLLSRLLPVKVFDLGQTAR
ncbi:Glyoxylase, beta-lactamase superfamily II [Catalinimonas alkaloidigena]|uniref:Glyoxylase, beta-lactamase superfamily II n=1 Tax=Catalinimonas alkaloidigena TaxID=1075417 RepID=A0A1G9AU97_9BACT|nr:MBL fold metallo-hydrolase [Catalinimonas alkaloidigena]SDK30210.1 Glyoxylase, beta-lactamase superfamily II [Catalinimonas alkaloidigena]